MNKDNKKKNPNKNIDKYKKINKDSVFMINKVYSRTNKNILETKEENRYQQHYKEEEVYNIYNIYRTYGIYSFRQNEKFN